MSSAIRFNLDQSTILSSGNGLTLYLTIYIKAPKKEIKQSMERWT